MNGTHGEIITDNNGIPLAFIDGIPDQCDHDDQGEWLHFNANGRYWRDSEIPKSDLAKQRFYKSRGIIGGCCSCSKCGKPFDINSIAWDI